MGWFSPRYRVEYWTYGQWQHHDGCEHHRIGPAAAFMASRAAGRYSVRHYRLIKLDTRRVLMRLSRTGWLNDHEIPGDDVWYPGDESEYTLIRCKPEAEWWD